MPTIISCLSWKTKITFGIGHLAQANRATVIWESYGDFYTPQLSSHFAVHLQSNLGGNSHKRLRFADGARHHTLAGSGAVYTQELFHTVIFVLSIGGQDHNHLWKAQKQIETKAQSGYSNRAWMWLLVSPSVFHVIRSVAGLLGEIPDDPRTQSWLGRKCLLTWKLNGKFWTFKVSHNSHDGPLHADSHGPSHSVESLKQRLGNFCIPACVEHQPVVQIYAAYQRETSHLFRPVSCPWIILILRDENERKQSIPQWNCYVMNAFWDVKLSVLPLCLLV